MWSVFPLQKQLGMYSANKCLATSSLVEKEQPWFKAFDNFYGVNISTMTNFKLPTDDITECGVIYIFPPHRYNTPKLSQEHW